jgi:hypothetical protein
MQVTPSAETSVNFCRTAWYHIPKGSAVNVLNNLNMKIIHACVQFKYISTEAKDILRPVLDSRVFPALDVRYLRCSDVTA